MGKADAWMPLYVGDYLAATTGLNTTQHGAYLLLLIHAWKNEGRLPNCDRTLATITKLSLKKWREHAPVLLPFFVIDDEGLSHKRVAAERGRAKEISDKRREAGARGGRPKKQMLSAEKANAFVSGLQSETQSQSQVRGELLHSSPLTGAIARELSEEARTLRALIVERKGEGFAASYFDPATVDGPTIRARTATAFDKLRREFGRDALDLGLAIGPPRAADLGQEVAA